MPRSSRPQPRERCLREAWPSVLLWPWRVCLRCDCTVYLPLFQSSYSVVTRPVCVLAVAITENGCGIPRFSHAHSRSFLSFYHLQHSSTSAVIVICLLYTSPS